MVSWDEGSRRSGCRNGVIPPQWECKNGSGGACVAVFRLLLVILDVLFIILCMIECSGDLEASYSAVP